MTELFANNPSSPQTLNPQTTLVTQIQNVEEVTREPTTLGLGGRK